MGIDVHALRLLEHAFRSEGGIGSTLTIGRQELHANKRATARHLRIPVTSPCLDSAYVDQLLMEHFGASEVASIDASDYEGCTYTRDLNLPLEADFPKYDTVIDAGSLEHILDVSVAFNNITRCCKAGGQILHVTPTNNFVGHGFYQFSPELFFGFYSQARGFGETEVFLVDHAKPGVWWKVAPPTGHSRSIAMSRNETSALVRTRKVSEESGTLEIQQPLYETLWQTAAEEADRGPIPSFHDGLRKLGNRLPTNVVARLVQMRNKSYSAMNSKNAALFRVDAPTRRSDPIGQNSFGR